jgi:hypothetical protein
MLIAEEDHLPRAVGVHRPQVMVAHLAAVHVFPPLVEDAAIGQGPRGVLVLHVGREPTDVSSIRVATVEHGHLGNVARHPPLAAAGGEDDVAVGEIRRLDVVVRAVGELAEAGAVELRLVEAVIGLAAPAVGEEDGAAVVVELGVAHAALRVVEERGHLAGLEVQPAEPPAVVVVPPPLGVEDVVAEVGVPVSVGIGLPDGEEDLVHAHALDLCGQLAPACGLRLLLPRVVGAPLVIGQFRQHLGLCVVLAPHLSGRQDAVEDRHVVHQAQVIAPFLVEVGTDADSLAQDGVDPRLDGADLPAVVVEPGGRPVVGTDYVMPAIGRDATGNLDVQVGRVGEEVEAELRLVHNPQAPPLCPAVRAVDEEHLVAHAPGAIEPQAHRARRAARGETLVRPADLLVGLEERQRMLAKRPLHPPCDERAADLGVKRPDPVRHRPPLLRVQRPPRHQPLPAEGRGGMERANRDYRQQQSLGHSR